MPFNENLRTELLERIERDQAMRKRIGAEMTRKQFAGEAITVSEMEAMAEVDRENTR